MAYTGKGLNFKDGTDTTVAIAANTGLDAVDVTFSIPTTSFTRKNTLTTKGDLYVATGSATVTRLGVGANTAVLKADSAQTEGVKWETVKESELTFTDITTNDVTTAKHGFVPKAPNDTSKFLRGDATWAAPAGGSGSVGSDTIWDAKGDIAAATGADAAVKVTVGSNDQVLVADSAQTAGVKWAGIDGGSA